MDHKPSASVTSLPNPFESRDAVITAHGNGRPPLRTDWVERIFAVLAAGFGSRFSDQLAGVDPDQIKSLWARKLSGFFNQPDAIRKALDDATDAKFPPNVGEFVALCQKHYQTKRRVEAEHWDGVAVKRPDIVAQMAEIVGLKVKA